MRRLTAVPLAAGVLIIVSPVAHAATPSFRDRIDDTYPIENFCGSGVTVLAHELTTAQGWETDTTFKVAFNSRTTYTYGDRSVSDHWAGRSFGVLVEGDLDGAHTEFWQERGLRAYLKAPGIGPSRATPATSSTSSASPRRRRGRGPGLRGSRSSRTPATTSTSTSRCGARALESSGSRPTDEGDRRCD